MAGLGADDVTFEDLANLYEESQDGLADIFLQDVPFYNLIKSEPADDLDPTDAQVMNFLCEKDSTDLEDFSHEETCCSNDCQKYSSETRSPESDNGNYLLQSPESRKKCSGSRKNRTPNTLRHILEKHRHSERIRHHTLNEQLKVICQQVPGSADDSRETKVVMMQRVISYIAFLENTIKLLCHQLDTPPHPNWTLLTDNFSKYFKDYFKDMDYADEEVLSATENIPHSYMDEDSSCSGMNQIVSRMKVSSPTVHSTTDSVVPIAVPHVNQEVTVLSQDSTVPSSSVSFGADIRVLTQARASGVNIGSTHGDTEIFFSPSVDDSVSTVLEISSTTQHPRPFSQLSFTSPVTSFYTVQKYNPEPEPRTIRRNKRKQTSPKRSGYDDDYLSDRAYLPSWSTVTDNAVGDHGDDSSSPKRLRELPYNIRCNHRHAVQRLQATRGKNMQGPAPTVMQIVPATQNKNSVTLSKSEDKLSTKLDLRKTSWMNGFMMFSRLNRRKFIQAHPGVHTSHISKIMGYAWRNMNREEQAPYKEKAKLCSQELYRTYTSQPEFALYSPVAAAAVAAAAAAATTTTSTSATTNNTAATITASTAEATSDCVVTFSTA